MATTVSPRPIAHGITTARRAAGRVEVSRTLTGNMVVARYLVTRTHRPLSASAIVRPVTGIILLAATGAMLVLASLPATIDALLAVGLIGLAAGRLAATTAHQRSPSARRRPANDNAFRLVLPPHLLRC